MALHWAPTLRCPARPPSSLPPVAAPSIRVPLYLSHFIAVSPQAVSERCAGVTSPCPEAPEAVLPLLRANGRPSQKAHGSAETFPTTSPSPGPHVAQNPLMPP